MAEDNRTLDTFYENWKQYQDLVKAAIAPLTEEQLELRAAPHLRTVRELAIHMIGTRVGWFTGFLGESDEVLKSISLVGRDESLKLTADQLVHDLEVTWQMIADALARWSSADMATTFTRERGGQTHTMPRQWVIWHLIEHDLHHGGELSLTLGMHGLTGVDI